MKTKAGFVGKLIFNEPKELLYPLEKPKKIRYPCNQCEYTARDHSTLKKHKKSKHELILYSCDYDDFPAATTTTASESDYCDLISEINEEEHMILKRESSDLSEFLEKCNEEDIISDSGDLDYDIINTEPKEDIWNPDIKAEFFPPLYQRRYFDII